MANTSYGANSCTQVKPTEPTDINYTWNLYNASVNTGNYCLIAEAHIAIKTIRVINVSSAAKEAAVHAHWIGIKKM